MVSYSESGMGSPVLVNSEPSQVPCTAHAPHVTPDALSDWSTVDQPQP